VLTLRVAFLGDLNFTLERSDGVQAILLWKIKDLDGYPLYPLQIFNNFLPVFFTTLTS
jgi:hypothetical protein